MEILFVKTHSFHTIVLGEISVFYAVVYDYGRIWLYMVMVVFGYSYF